MWGELPHTSGGGVVALYGQDVHLPSRSGTADPGSKSAALSPALRAGRLRHLPTSAYSQHRAPGWDVQVTLPLARDLVPSGPSSGRERSLA